MSQKKSLQCKLMHFKECWMKVCPIKCEEKDTTETQISQWIYTQNEYLDQFSAEDLDHREPLTLLSWLAFGLRLFMLEYSGRVFIIIWWQMMMPWRR